MSKKNDFRFSESYTMNYKRYIALGEKKKKGMEGRNKGAKKEGMKGKKQRLMYRKSPKLQANKYNVFSIVNISIVTDDFLEANK